MDKMIKWNSNYNLVKITEKNYVRGDYVYDENDTNFVSSYVYDENNRIIEYLSLSEENPAKYIYEYDENDNLVKEIDYTGLESIFEYDENNNLIKGFDGIFCSKDRARVVFRNDNLIILVHDENNNIIEEISPSTTMYEYEYKFFTYDDRGDCVRIRYVYDDSDYYVDLVYDDNHNCIAEINENGNCINNYGYDENNRLITEQELVDGRIGIYEYDDKGDCIRYTSPLGKIIEYTYDDHHNCIVRKLIDGLYGDCYDFYSYELKK